ncbi:MAG TPA: ferredoxin [Streptosporangiaceae bacterium]|nr:ferredoxin [Streptosporangiaceae bacterium]
MRVEADLDACQGYVCCVMAAPEVFDVDDDTAKVVLLNGAPDEALRAKVENAVRSCPSRALRVIDS